MTDTVRVPRTTVVRLLAVVPKGSGLAVHLAAMLAASPQGEGSSALTADGILQSIEMAVDAETWALLKGEAANRIAANTLTLIGGRQG